MKYLHRRVLVLLLFGVCMIHTPAAVRGKPSGTAILRAVRFVLNPNQTNDCASFCLRVGRQVMTDREGGGMHLVEDNYGVHLIRSRFVAAHDSPAWMFRVHCAPGS